MNSGIRRESASRRQLLLYPLKAECVFVGKELGPVYTKGKRRYFDTVWPLIYMKTQFLSQKTINSKKTLAKVEISDNTGYVLSCQLGETGF